MMVYASRSRNVREELAAFLEEPMTSEEEPGVPIGSLVVAIGNLVAASMVWGVHGSHGLQRKRSQLEELQLLK